MKCWNCQAERGARAFCSACGKIGEPQPGASFFDVFGLPAAYQAVEVAALERGFRERSLLFHPDRFTQATPRERRFSLEHSTQLNDAYKTLKDPLRRAFYLLKLRGVDLDREDASAQKDMPLPFLEEVMELREALDEAIEAKDLSRAQSMAAEVTQRQKTALAEGVAALEREDAEASRRASHALGRVRYFTRFLEQVEAFEEDALG